MRVQSYEKTREKPNIFELFRVQSKFGVAKGSNKLWIMQTIHNKKSCYGQLTFAGFIMKGGVVPPGIEPGTHGFSVRCSTN